MGNSSSAPKVTAQDRAILDLKIQRDKLHQYQRRITILTSRETAIARECVSRGDRAKALLALRNKKHQETLLARTDTQLAQLERLAMDVEFALVQKDILFGLQQGTKVLKEIQREMGSVEGVERLMGESEEARAYQEEIRVVLEGSLNNQEEDEVEDELEQLEREEGVVATEVQKLPSAPQRLERAEALPDAPQETPQERAKRRARTRAREDEEAREERKAEPVTA